MNTYCKIFKSKIDSYNSKLSTLDPADMQQIVVNGVILKDEPHEDEECEVIYANTGGEFSPEYWNASAKFTFLLRQSHILKESFYEYGHRGGFHMPDKYDDDELWDDYTYINVVKQMYYIELKMKGLPCENVNFRTDEIWYDCACRAFRKQMSVLSALPFPGLAFRATYTDLDLLKKWLEMPQVSSLLEANLNRLSPDVVLSACCLQYLSRTESIDDVLGVKIIERDEDDSYVIDENGRIYVFCYHPCRVSHEYMISIADKVQKLLSKKSKN